MGQEIKPLALLEHATCKDSIHMFDEEKFIPGGISDQKQMVDIELAILTERDSELTNIAGSMRQIRDIQKDLALVVDSQDDDIQRLNRKSVEALDHAQSGLGHVTATTHRQDDQIWVHKAIAFAAAAMVLCYIVVGLFHSST